jgi:hypothetical protein
VESNRSWLNPNDLGERLAVQAVVQFRPYRLIDLRRIRQADETDHGDIVVRQLESRRSDMIDMSRGMRTYNT